MFPPMISLFRHPIDLCYSRLCHSCHRRAAFFPQSDSNLSHRRDSNHKSCSNSLLALECNLSSHGLHQSLDPREA